MNILHKASEIFLDSWHQVRDLAGHTARLLVTHLPKIGHGLAGALHKRNIPLVRAFVIAHLPKARQVFFGPSRKTRIVSSVGLMLAMCAFGAVAVAPTAPETTNLPSKVVELELALPNLSDQITALGSQDQHFVREEKVRLGDTLSSLFARMGVSDPAALTFIRSDTTARALLRLKAGQVLQVRVSANGELQWLSTTAPAGSDGMKNIVISREEQGFTAVDTSAELEKRVEMRSGVIQSSLFAATDEAHIPDPVVNKFVDMFSTNVDFRADLRRGDRFNLVYETYWQNGNYIRAGRILAAEFVNAGKAYQAIWFDDASGKSGYYNYDGKALKKAFLKSPVAFTRISSGFSMRLHPVLGTWKHHKGIDFAAPTGTPIRAAADGVIESFGMRGGYGNMVVLKHWAPYSTAYGHMSRFAAGLRQGMKVSQGDVIGYVGTTGMSTGPHLHYEFRINSVQHDPLSIDMPNAQPLTTAEVQKFRAVKDDMLHRFALLNPSLKTAAN